MFGNWYHWNSCFTVRDHQHPSFPQGEVEGAVGGRSVAVPRSLPWHRRPRGQTFFLVFNWGVGGLGRFSITVLFFC